MKTRMKVYEIGVEDHYDECSDGVDCTIWIAVPEGINIEQIRTDDWSIGAYVKYIPEYNENTPGVDFIFHKDVAS